MDNFTPKRLYRVLDLPGFRGFEDLVIRHGRAMLDDCKRDELSKDIFGLSYLETLILEHENSYESETAELDEYLAIPILDNLGLDFRNDYQKPLKCTKAFCRQAEYAIKFNQWTPEVVLGQEDVMADRLSRDAERWLAERHR
ncbi:hypothetical protein EV667_0216 [Ancylobacter aquaticus]|uniref:Uncharacterized protein n=1 Tax=Ancylobacter aquaticus TaxID=100 RepID=A0A4R1I971_ANCAQ|nr:hypothetical protein [Ancylobacter aquaticus]TCK30130.1 hypothetical protein EV667_0216 [Ancylobacter aquaticus]